MQVANEETLEYQDRMCEVVTQRMRLATQLEVSTPLMNGNSYVFGNVVEYLLTNIVP